MDIRLILTKLLTLLFHENQLDDKTSKEICRRVLETIKVPDIQYSMATERNAIICLRNTVLWLLNEHNVIDKTLLIQRLKIDLSNDGELKEAVLDVIVDYEKEKRYNIIVELRAEINSYFAKNRITDLLKRSYTKAEFNSQEIDNWDVFKESLISELSILSANKNQDVTKGPNYLAVVHSDDDSTMDAAVISSVKNNDPEYMIPLVWKAYGRMMGDPNGKARRGRHNLICALGNMYKSGFLKDQFAYTACYTKPKLIDPTKRPALVHITTEDTIDEVIKVLYVIYMQLEFKLPVKMDGVTPDEISAYVKSKLKAQGWNYFIVAVKASSYTLTEYFQLLNQLKNQDFEVVQITCDYPSKFSTDGIEAKTTGDDHLALHTMIREYMVEHNILHWAAHQLSSDANQLFRDREDDYIHLVGGKGYFQKTKKLDTIPDFLAYTAKRKTRNGTYQEFVWGRNRDVGGTPSDDDMYFALRYNEAPMYGIRHDVGDEDNSLRRVGDVVGESNDLNW